MAKSSSFTGELIHFGSARLRITGSGNLQSRFRSLDDVKSYTLPNIAMSAATDIEPLILGNFTSQRACYEFKTTAIDEVLKINNITIFVRVVASGIPQ